MQIGIQKRRYFAVEIYEKDADAESELASLNWLLEDAGLLKGGPLKFQEGSVKLWFDLYIVQGLQKANDLITALKLSEFTDGGEEHLQTCLDFVTMLKTERDRPN